MMIRKEFSRLVCVSLFSYQGCLSVISLRQPIYFIISFRSCQALFSKVFQTLKKLYKVVCFCRSVQATWLLYHILSTVSSTFLKFFIFSKFKTSNGEGGIWTLAPLLTTYSLSRGAPSASLGTSPNCPRVVILPDNSLHTFVFFIRLFRCFLIEKPCALYRTFHLFVKYFFQNF